MRPLTRQRWVISITIALIFLVLASLLGLSFGTSQYGGFDMVWSVLTGQADATQAQILLQARLPRVIMAIGVGAALATSGAVFQAVLRNPLADPYILGISGGAALGGSLALTLVGAGTLAISVHVGAFAGAMVALAAMGWVARSIPGGRISTFVLLLAGVIFNAFASAAIMFLKAIVNAQKAQELLFYLMGTLNVEGMSWLESGAIVTFIFIALAIVMFHARDLNVGTLGDQEAATLGVDVRRLRRNTVIASSFAVALAVAYTGLIGFVGLVVPHGIRLFAGPDHRLLLPLCAIGGGAFLVLCDVIARTSFVFTSTALPVGVVTAFVGAPLFVFFLTRHLKMGSE